MHKQLFAVAGNPVLHSLSPDMFNQYFESKGINAVCLRILAKNGEDALTTAVKAGFTGINITAPFKEEAFHLADEKDRHSSGIGAVNTVIFKNGIKQGFNTDWTGVLEPFKKRNIDLAGRKVLIAGAGGAAKAAVYAMTREKAEVTVTNRTEKKGIELAEKNGVRFAPLSNIAELMDENEIIISTISGGINVFPENGFKPHHIIFDADYHHRTVSEAASNRGSAVIHGTEWLLNQAEHSLKLFTNKDLSGLKLPEIRSKKDNIAFIGFTGGGKSSTARELAKLLDRPLFDTDDFIEQNELITISEIFAKKGEPYFRELEDKAVRVACSLKNHVISFGGGAALSETNCSAIRSGCLVFWLFADPKTTIERLGTDILKKPLLHSSDDPVKKAETLLERRIPYYAECADELIDTTKMTPAQIAEMIVEEINRTLSN